MYGVAKLLPVLALLPTLRTGAALALVVVGVSFDDNETHQRHGHTPSSDAASASNKYVVEVAPGSWCPLERSPR